MSSSTATGSMKGESGEQKVSLGRLARRPVAALHLMPKDTILFMAGGVAGALGKTLTAPLDRVSLLYCIYYDLHAPVGVILSTCTCHCCAGEMCSVSKGETSFVTESVTQRQKSFEHLQQWWFCITHPLIPSSLPTHR